MRLADITDDGEIPPKKKVGMGSRDGYEVAYKSDHIKKGMISKQRYTIKDGKAFIVTTSAASIAQTDPRPFPLFERLYTSFEFLEKDFASKSTSIVFEHLIHKVLATPIYCINHGIVIFSLLPLPLLLSCCIGQH